MAAETVSNRFIQLQGYQNEVKKAIKKEQTTNTGMISTGKIYLENYTRKIVTKAKMREISKNFFMREGDNISLQNARVSHKMRET